MKIAYISSYLPRECGIATFTHNLFWSVTDHGEDQSNEGVVIAMDDQDEGYNYPPEVGFKIRQEQQEDYLEAARFINLCGADVCILEHEYGIFGGQNGIYVLPLLHQLEIPLIVTLHTVLKTPSYNEKAVLIEICKMANKVVVMTRKAVMFLTTIYAVPAEKISIIEHGVPDLHFSHDAAKKKFKLENKKMLMTFGFISRNKGIETVIKALPEVVKKYPETVYIIIGKTHPAVLRHSGEEYRVSLLLLIKRLQLEKHVIFLNEFINEKELFQYLYASDIYITPYLNEAQITSGTLSYAVGAGASVLSTPYWHAEELLDENRGRLFDFNDSEGLSVLLVDLFDHPEKLTTLRKNAYAFGQEVTWPKTGNRYDQLARGLLELGIEEPFEKEPVLDPLVLPPFLLDHIRRLTDDTGIIQHAKFGIPNLKEGYCLDDNARALLLVLMAYKQKRLQLALELMPIYLSYIHYMQNPDGTFRNFLSFSRNFLDEKGSEDSFGRAIWSLGFLMANAPNDAYYQSGKEIFFEAAPNFENLQSIRSIANTMIGMSYYLKRNPNDEGMAARLHKMAHRLVDEYDQHTSGEWHWFESLLAYDNAMLPLALLHAAKILKDETIEKTAIESMHFLTSITMQDGFLSVVGNEKWYQKDGIQSKFAQQPIDALAMVLMFHEAYHLTKNKIYLTQLHTSFMWFLGENDLRMSLYDFETKGCCDGLESYGVNRNQGAESTLAYLISHLTMLSAFEDIYKLEKE